ncbi:uncharacterized protein LDX57_010557 [Aspergillus melleus]|uniref:uncharacterized protein n=1 Tax=Aspergillus melleus TaxID=138277 RepID=UPI001E8CA0FE|nr:uncharacterized protein LDX57_010557 [Aspergillus melleus]KAH8432924.1 hypothetical protein LDX57_010557 [Aspergillus melleus]
MSPSCDREVVTESSETQINGSLNLGPCTVLSSPDEAHSPIPGGPLSTLLIGRSHSGNTDATDDPAIEAPSQGTVSQLESQDTELSLEKAFEDVATEPSPFQSCQCTEEALELLEQVCVQGRERWSTFGGSKSSTFENWATVRAVVLRLGLFATCFDCKDVPRLMTLLVLLSERLCAVFRITLETTPSEDVLGSGVPSRQEIYTYSDTLRGYRMSHRTDGYDDPTVTLCCGRYSLDVSEETSTLFITLYLASLQQFRKALIILWDRAQEEQSHGHLETLRSIKEQLHAVSVAMNARLTAE